MKRVLSVLLVLALVLGCCPAALAAGLPSEAEATQIMKSMQGEYYEGRHWTNDDYYGWHGGIFNGGFGCAGFAFLLSDKVFGYLPARMVTPVRFDEVRVGDILRVNNDTHSVIVLEKRSETVVLAEGNYNSSIHWGRLMTRAEVEASDYLLTRYPDGDTDPGQTGFEEGCPSQAFRGLQDPSAWYHKGVDFVLKHDLMKGNGNGTFAPGGYTSRAMAAQILYNLDGTPDGYGATSGFQDVLRSQWYAKAVTWAKKVGIIAGKSDTIFDPNGNVTREEFGVMLYHFVQYRGWDDTLLGDLGWFKDGGSVSSWAKNAMTWAVGRAVFQGDEYLNLSPRDPITRAQVATVLSNLIVYSDGNVLR